MRVLVACEYSGTVRDAFTIAGHDAWSCDLLDSDKPGKHIKGDVLQILNDGWDMMIGHPPCTYLSNSGVSWLYRKENRWEMMRQGAEFFKKLLEADIPKIAVENPIPHKYALEIIGRKYDQIIQPYQFGHLESKATCLWLKCLPGLNETNNVKQDMLKLDKAEWQRLHYLPPSKDRGKLRSKTFDGIAEAMAKQWSDSPKQGQLLGHKRI
jgi:hypothetical protein